MGVYEIVGMVVAQLVVISMISSRELSFRVAPQQRGGCRFPSPHRSTLLSRAAFPPVPRTLQHRRAHIQTTSRSQKARPGHDNDTTSVQWLAGISDLC